MNDIKNQKIKEDIQKKLNADEAELALKILQSIEQDGLNDRTIQKIADDFFKGDER